MIVVKAGGRALAQNLDNIAKSIAKRASEGMRIIFVHGGGDLVSEYERRMGIEPKFVVSPQGIRSRYTDEAELEVFVMVMAGKLNKEIVSRLQRYGANAIGISGADGGFLKAERKKKIVIVDERGRTRAIPGGYTGRIIEVNTSVVENLLNSFQVLVIAPIALGTEYELLNVDADQAAARISMGIKAEKLLILTDVEGVIVDGGVLGSISVDEAEKLQPKIGTGMNRKVMMCCEAVRSGVEEAIISTGLIDDPLEALEREIGTRIKT